MVEKIKANKDKVLEFMERELTKYGPDRMDVKEMGELADIVKDLAMAEKECWEAQYYRTVTDAMQQGSSETSGYGTPSRMGYGGMGGRQGYGGSNMMGHSDPIAAIRDMLATANPEMRSQIRNELRNI